MSYEQKYAKAIAELKNAGLVRQEYSPDKNFIYRTFGVRLRPPYYFEFWRSVLLYGGLLAVGLTFSSWLIGLHPRTIEGKIFFLVFQGAFFGFFMTLINKNKARKHKLSRWEDL
ncbi:hypothetical protein GGD81_001320 [Rhodobium orientis]|uniref:DUF6404 family protein n=1 Tax=Rhodobium orientis TaxID=34017 RepID=UPI0011B94055|nr:DUF6404 family protein [Rhodobium orientis]MBB4302293.1 hypothetical protein [Rhodobium orientis]